jgi:hypothetical protein
MDSRLSCADYPAVIFPPCVDHENNHSIDLTESRARSVYSQRRGNRLGFFLLVHVLIRYAYNNRQKVVKCNQRPFVNVANDRATLCAGHGDNLINHNLR